MNSTIVYQICISLLYFFHSLAYDYFTFQFIKRFMIVRTQWLKDNNNNNYDDDLDTRIIFGNNSLIINYVVLFYVVQG